MCYIGNIYGIWFYDRDECARLGLLMNRCNFSLYLLLLNLKVLFFSAFENYYNYSSTDKQLVAFCFCVIELEP